MIIEFKAIEFEGMVTVPKIQRRHVDAHEALTNSDNKQTKSLFNSQLFDAHLAKVLHKAKILQGTMRLSDLEKKGASIDHGFLTRVTLNISDNGECVIMPCCHNTGQRG